MLNYAADDFMTSESNWDTVVKFTELPYFLFDP
jgi:hypothetical protein